MTHNRHDNSVRRASTEDQGLGQDEGFISASGEGQKRHELKSRGEAMILLRYNTDTFVHWMVGQSTSTRL
jgi:hypothetical protein